MGSLLMHASIPITPFFLDFCVFPFFFTLFLPCSTFISCRASSSLSLFTTMVFCTACRDKIYHFYPLITFGSL